MIKQVSKTAKDQELYELQAGLCKALAHPTRFAIIHHLTSDSCSVSKLAERLNVGQANLSQHLAILRDVGIATPRRSGNNVIYSIADERIVKACALIRESLGDRIARQKDLFGP